MGGIPFGQVGIGRDSWSLRSLRVVKECLCRAVLLRPVRPVRPGQPARIDQSAGSVADLAALESDAGVPYPLADRRVQPGLGGDGV